MIIFLAVLAGAFLLGNWIGLWLYRLHPVPSDGEACSKK
jgi:hypothetical protein